jgi:D-hydroxyproline dehydrogenase subunit alpha
VSPEVVIVGAGPAGLAAATLLAEHAADVLVVDEQRAAGGQIWRQPPAELATGGGTGRETIAAAERAGARFAYETSAWAVFGLEAPLDPFAGGREQGLAVGLSGPGGISEVGAQRILLAPGAYDLPVPFPGWTLPGVMGAGGVQAFLKAQRLLPGGRFVLAGAHPLLLTIAGDLLSAGGEVVLLAFAGARPGISDLPRALPAVARNPAALADGARSLRRLARAGVPVEFGQLVVRAEGDGQLESAVLVPVDGNWRPAGAEQSLACDVLALGYGFSPSTELARQAGCTCRWDGAAGGWVVRHDAWMRTTQPELYAAGEITGVAGAEQALEEGRLAALGILVDLGRASEDQADRLGRPIRRRLRALRRFSGEVQRQFVPRHEALAQLASDETVVCRCEGLTAGTLDSALAENPHLGTADALKLLTRAGMGPCQGRMCEHTVAHLIARATGRSIEAVGTYTARAPVKPIRLADLAAAVDA